MADDSGRCRQTRRCLQREGSVLTLGTQQPCHAIALLLRTAARKNLVQVTAGTFLRPQMLRKWRIMSRTLAWCP